MAGPANARALRQLSDVWENLDVLKSLADVLPEIGEPHNGGAAGTMSPALSAAPAAASRQRRIFPAVAAALGGVVLVATFAVHRYLDAGSPGPTLAHAEAASYATTVGERREVALADGSSLAINTGSLVEIVALQGATRELRLLHGETLFTVAHDASRPFRVRAGQHVVEAVGTAFDVRLHDDGALEVIVTDGRVRLLAGTETRGYLERGQAMRIERDGTSQVASLSEEALAARLAWRQGMIVFNGEPLSQALAEFARYTPTRFIVADAATRSRPVGGSIPVGDVDSLLEALHANLALEAKREADGSIRIGPQR
jgi:transmembrane sensor